jgi:hypothetical protein
MYAAAVDLSASRALAELALYLGPYWLGGARRFPPDFLAGRQWINVRRQRHRNVRLGQAPGEAMSIDMLPSEAFQPAKATMPY